MNPEIPQVEEHNVVALLTRVKGIINQHKQTSHNINRLMRRLREDMNANERTLIKDQLVNEFEAALFQGRVPPEIVPELALLLVYISVEAIEIVTTQNGDSIVICFLCKTVKALYKLGQMITSGFMHAVFAAVIKSLVHRPTTVDVYVRADEFNFKVLHLSSPHDKGKLVTYNMKLLHKCHFGTCHRPIDCQNQNYTAPRAQTSGRPECLPKVMWYSNLDFRINPDSDPDVRQITAKMLWIHYLVSISHFAENHENWPVTV